MRDEFLGIAKLNDLIGIIEKTVLVVDLVLIEWDSSMCQNLLDFFFFLIPGLISLKAVPSNII